jgi:hypothetical protein
VYPEKLVVGKYILEILQCFGYHQLLFVFEVDGGVVNTRLAADDIIDWQKYEPFAGWDSDLACRWVTGFEIVQQRAEFVGQILLF